MAYFKDLRNDRGHAYQPTEMIRLLTGDQRGGWLRSIGINMMARPETERLGSWCIYSDFLKGDIEDCQVDALLSSKLASPSKGRSSQGKGQKAEKCFSPEIEI